MPQAQRNFLQFRKWLTNREAYQRGSLGRCIFFIQCLNKYNISINKISNEIIATRFPTLTTILVTFILNDFYY